MELNTQQQAFFDRITNLDFTKIFLMGEAGTGKTYLLCEIAKWFDQNDFRVVFASPTHQAKQVIREKLGDDIGDIHLKTIASLLGRAMLRGSTGEMFALPPGVKRLQEYDIIICDEMSMVGESEVNTFLAPALKDKLMIFTGDPKQMPPVRQKAGNIWELIEVVTLTEQMRQKGEVYELAQKNIKSVEIPTQSSDDIKVSHSEKDLQDSFLNTIARATNPLDYLFLAYTNDEVDYMVAKVHEALYGSEPFNVGQYIKLDKSISIAAKGTEVQIVNLYQDIDPYYEGLFYYIAQVEYQGNTEEIKLLDYNESKRLENKIKYCLEQLRALIKDNDGDKNRDLIKITRNKLEDLEGVFTPVISPYVMTVHKAQGITKPNVWVLATKLVKAAHKRNLAYVAISRASNKLYINSIPAKIKCISYRAMLKQLKKTMGAKYYAKVYRVMKKDPNFNLRGDGYEPYAQRFIMALINEAI